MKPLKLADIDRLVARVIASPWRYAARPRQVSMRAYEAALKAISSGASEREVEYILMGMPPVMAKEEAAKAPR
jgi:hypothetical protein